MQELFIVQSCAEATKLMAARTSSQDTALHIAVRQANESMVALLIKYKADPNLETFVVESEAQGESEGLVLFAKDAKRTIQTQKSPAKDQYGKAPSTLRRICVMRISEGVCSRYWRCELIHSSRESPEIAQGKSIEGELSKPKLTISLSTNIANVQRRVKRLAVGDESEI